MILRSTGDDLLQVKSTNNNNNNKNATATAVLTKRTALQYISLLNSPPDRQHYYLKHLCTPHLFGPTPFSISEKHRTNTKLEAKFLRAGRKKSLPAPLHEQCHSCYVRSKDGETHVNNPASLQSSSDIPIHYILITNLIPLFKEILSLACWISHELSCQASFLLLSV